MRVNNKLMLKLTNILVVVILTIAGSAKAVSMADYEKSFIIDLEKDQFPTFAELEKQFDKENKLYDPRYHSVWELLGEFNRDFYARTATYGINEKRLKWDEEEDVLAIIKSMPEDMYPYIGPMLFLIPNMSEKVLNLPKIKETKNKFPERIAPQLKDVKDIEFLSPFLYYILKPEMWPENRKNIEIPQMTPYHPKVVYDEKFYQKIKSIVRPEKYMLEGNMENRVTRSEMRTINPDRNTLLTSADVKAFANTIDAVEDWYRSGDNRYKISQVAAMLLAVEQESDPTIAPGVRDLVNPCARLVIKAKIIGKERELAFRVAKEGFTLHEWAYTCDKVVKAYRTSLMSRYVLQALKNYKNGTYDDEINKLSPKYRAVRYSTMQALVEMYKVPLIDLQEVRKNRGLLEEKWRKYNFQLAETPLTRNN